MIVLLIRLMAVFLVALIPGLVPCGIYDQGSFFWILSYGLVWMVVMVSLIVGTRHLPVFRPNPHTAGLMILLVWLSAIVLAGIPMKLMVPNMSWVDVLFEAASGLTTTGAEVLLNLDSIPRGLIFYRLWLQFIGGLGIVMFVLIVFPLMGLNHNAGLKFDLPGPARLHGVGVRQLTLVRYLWVGYVLLALSCAFLLWSCGLSLFDAFSESLGVVSTGGFNVYKDGFNHYPNAVKYVVMCFMWISSIGVMVHAGFWLSKDLRVYLRDKEHQWMMILFLVTVLLVLGGDLFSPVSALDKIFTVMSMITTSGYSVSELNQWSSVWLTVLLTLSAIGGCTGSTSGGMKQARLRHLCHELSASLRAFLHPNLAMGVRVPMQQASLARVKSFSLMVQGYLLVFLGGSWCSVVLLQISGMDLVSAFSATLACLTNTGSSMGLLTTSYALLPTFSKTVLMIDMLLGRLECIPLAAAFYALLAD
ncbi:MAG: potassium transporter TrkG [Pseudomonadota bacterium]|nr:potassium transporter TrkG [Pseudomonadota bacterium]MEC8461206.1 potassium transporter TrkG [Pseudomonadota bacterium]